MIRLVYQRGAFDAAETTVVATALFWFAFSLPTNGLYLLQTRTFFSLQRPWQATSLAVIDLVVSAVAALALYEPFGVGGIVAGTGIGTSAAVVAQALILRREFGGLELGRLFSTASRITIASAALAGVGWLVWDLLDEALGRGLVGQIVSLGTGLAVGGARLRRGRQAAAGRRAGADHAPAAAAARCSGPAATCWGSPSWRCSSASPGWGRRRAAGLAAAAASGRAGASGDGGAGAGDPDLGGRAAGELRAGSRCRTAACSLISWGSADSSRLAEAVAHSCRGAWGRGSPRAAGRARDWGTADLVALLIARSPSSTSPAGSRRDLSTGMTGFDTTWYHGPFAAGFFQSGDTMGPALHRAAVPRLVLPGEQRSLPRGGDAGVRAGRAVAAAEPRLVRRLPGRLLVHRPAVPGWRLGRWRSERSR